MTAFLRATCSLVASLVVVSRVSAWGPDGHHKVADVADRLIKGSNAATQVQAVLGTISLKNAAVWADCAKGVDPTTFVYKSAGQYPECKIFETTAGEAEMIDFVQRNATNCLPKPGEETCHKQYHYSDVSIAHDHYDSGFIGARTDDVIGAIEAAIHVLKGDPSPTPFDFKDTREALLVLSHYMGDIHQPLHVGAVYLDAAGDRVDPDTGTFDPATATRGGNQIKVSGSSKNLHATWDAVPTVLARTLVKTAKTVPVTAGTMYEWPKAWASEAVEQAQAGFMGVTFDSLQSGHWTATLPTQYNSNSNRIKKKQLARAGARLAQLLEAIWP